MITATRNGKERVKWNCLATTRATLVPTHAITAIHSHGLVITVVDNSSLLSFQTFLLEPKVFLKDRGKAVPLEQGSLLDHLLPVVWNLLQVKHNRHVVACTQSDIHRHPVRNSPTPSQTFTDAQLDISWQTDTHWLPVRYLLTPSQIFTNTQSTSQSDIHWHPVRYSLTPGQSLTPSQIFTDTQSDTHTVTDTQSDIHEHPFRLIELWLQLISGHE